MDAFSCPRAATDGSRPRVSLLSILLREETTRATPSRVRVSRSRYAAFGFEVGVGPSFCVASDGRLPLLVPPRLARAGTVIWIGAPP
jgi:hypothetical protein